MARSQSLRGSLLAWGVVWAFWLATTHTFHPTFVLAMIVTTSLVTAYAAAVYVNHLMLLPKLWQAGRRWTYAGGLAVAMCLLTAGALVIIRVSYRLMWGPDPDPWGAYKHYLIDLFGMAVHVGAAAGAVLLFRRLTSRDAHP
jgi:hypothetical protein